MPPLREITPVERSVKQAQVALEQFFHSLEAPDGVARLRLSVPIRMPVKQYGVSIDREVRIEARPVRNPALDAEIMEISWVPEGTAIFPRFDGKLFLTGFGNAEVSYVELDGYYTPPFGAAGQVFDATIGQRIAQTTAREFLADLKAAIETS
ncbi:MAG: hypothetical protein WBE79_03650 [Candidatus Cybelea sp.]